MLESYLLRKYEEYEGDTMQYFVCPKHIINAFLKIALCLFFGCGFCITAMATTIENVSVQAAPLTINDTAVDGMVRVYLSSLGSPTTLTLTPVGNYSVNGNVSSSLASGQSVTVGFNKQTGAITFTNGGMSTNMGTYMALRRHSTSGDNGIKIQQAVEPSNPYPGDISFEAVKQSDGTYKLYTIAHVYIESYLYGVLPYEMGNSSGIEALKAQAVAARTYTARMMENRSSGKYDVVDTTSDQVYRGTTNGNANCVAAVNATKGIVLKSNGNYTATYYSASNGGQTESIANAWGTSGYDYLKVKDDPFDYANTSSTVKKCTLYKDATSSLNQSGLMRLLQEKMVSKLQGLGYAATTANTALQTLTAVTPHTPMYASPSRLYTKMDFTLTATTVASGGSQATVTTSVTCDIFDELESLLSMGIQYSDNELWSVSTSATTFQLQARRYGHGLGMSQRGAMQMAKLGYDYDDILGFYYEGAQRVRYSFTSTILSATGESQTTVDTPADLEDEEDGSCKATVHLLGIDDQVAMYAEKSTASSVIMAVTNGAIVEVLVDDGTWCFVKYGSMYGYLSKNALTMNGTPTGSESTSTTVSGFVTVTANDFVNLRASGSMSASVLGTATTGAVLTVFEHDGTWAHVQYNALTAYVHMDYVSDIVSTYPSNMLASGSTTATVKNGLENVSLLASPSTTASILATIPASETMTVVSSDGSWCKVSYNGLEGYVLWEHIQFTDTDQAPDEDTNETTPAPTVTPAPDALQATVTTQSGSLNMRMDPTAGSRVVTTIPRGATVNVTLIGNENWYGVSYNGYAGYAMSMYLTLSGDVDEMPELEAGKASVMTESGSLNLRAEPITGSEILRTIPQYAVIEVQSRGAEWSMVTYDGTQGYVMSMFLSFGETVVLPTPTPTPTVTPDGTEDPTSPVEPMVTPSVAPDAVYAVVSTASGSLNLRNDPLLGSRVLARIPKGSSILIEEKYETWSKTTYAGMSGYVMNSFLSFQTGQPDVDVATTSAMVNTSSGSLNLRLEPSLAAGVVLRIPQYVMVEVSQSGSEWSSVYYQGSFGYVMTSYLLFSDEPTLVPSPSPTIDPNATLIPTPSVQTVAWVFTDSGSLNLRASADSDAKVLTTIPRLAPVEVLGVYDAWSVVMYNGYSGYAMTDFLTYIDPSVQAVTPTPTLQPSPTPDSQGESTLPKEEENVEEPIPVPTETPQVPSFETAIDETLETMTQEVLATIDPDEYNLPLWKYCSEIGEQVTMMYSGEMVQVLQKGDTWCMVQYEDKQGYCLTSQITIRENNE